jgi:hypothetical protein
MRFSDTSGCLSRKARYSPECVEGAFCELRPYGVLGSPPLNSSPILLAQAGRAAPQCLDAAPAPVHLVEQTILLSGQREVLLPAPIRLALRSPLRPLLLLGAYMISYTALQYAPAQHMRPAKPVQRSAWKAFSAKFVLTEFAERRLYGILRSPWSRRSQSLVASRARRDPAPPARGVIPEREDVQPPGRLLRERELVRPADVDGAVDDRRRRAHDSIVRQEAPNLIADEPTARLPSFPRQHVAAKG